MQFIYILLAYFINNTYYPNCKQPSIFPVNFICPGEHVDVIDGLGLLIFQLLWKYFQDNVMPVYGDKLYVVTSSTNLIKYFLLINLVSCENVFKYTSLKDETGSLVCANAHPDLVIYRIRSTIACATSCSSDSQCEDFNFSSRLQLCELFYSSQTLQFQISRNCVFYTV